MSMMCPATADDTNTCPQNIMTLEELTTLEKLNDAFYEYSKASLWKESTQKHLSELLLNNVKLQEDLRNGRYKASKTSDFTLNERGKIRKIEAPAIRDRIVQKVLCQQILLPHLTKALIYDNYASLKQRGTSFARKRIDVLLRRYIRQHGSEGYILQVDIKKYFDSIDHDILKKMLHRKIYESKEIMDLIDYIVDTSSKTNKGLSLGAEAPQVFALYYLSGIDNFIKTVKGIKYYGRYMDDMFILSDSKEELKTLLDDIKAQLVDLKLEVNTRKTHITKLSHGFTFMQIKYLVKNGKIIKRPTHTKIVRERRRLKKYKILLDKSLIDERYIRNCYKSWRNGVLKDCNSSKRSIRSLDSLYNKLFPIRQIHIREKRDVVIGRIFTERYANS